MELMKRNWAPLSAVSKNFQPQLPNGLMDNCENGALQKI